MNDPLEMEDVDAFTTGAIGQPGQRTFYLQVRKGREVMTFKCEKQQVAVLASSIGRLLEDLPVPTEAPLPTAMELVEPLAPQFVVGQMVLGYDIDIDRFVVQLAELRDSDITTEDEDEDEGEGENAGLADEADRMTARFTFSRGQARSFSAFADEVVAAGRPSCRFCGGPIDPDGHPCPRMN